MLLAGCGLCLVQIGRDFSRPVFNMVEALPYGLIEMSGGVGVGLGTVALSWEEGLRALAVDSQGPWELVVFRVSDLRFDIVHRSG